MSSSGRTTNHRRIVAIDGPAGAGKSTLAAHLAARFGLLNLETGAMYRAFALKALESAVPVNDAAGLKTLSGATSIRLEPSSAGNRVFLDDIEVTARIRQPDVTEAASRVSVHPAIRAWMVTMQRRLGDIGGVVMEGRDIGTAVFPDADVKIFLDASPEVRGLRRFEQLESSSQSAQSEAKAPSEQQAGGAAAQERVLQEIKERDERDRTRAESPLKPASDAIIIDSSCLTFDQVLAAAEGIVTRRLGPPLQSWQT
ncbi:MAG TPA: (d)CMP kinase [Acidisarcina sp.]